MRRESFIKLTKCKLSLLDKNGHTIDYIFDQDVVHIGYKDENDLCIKEPSVSNLHCIIYKDKGSFLIKDIGSESGTFINGVRIKEAYLQSGYKILIGNVPLHFEILSDIVQIVPSKKDKFGKIVGMSIRMKEIFSILQRVSKTEATILLEGETGTGKEVFARTIHSISHRAKGPFVVVDCGAIPENLLESELFGHEKGSFTGAVARREGLFEQANGGTIFLDEIGELSMELQPKLLRALERKEIKRVGSNRLIKIDVRIIAATNRDLLEEVKKGNFREDLYFRLAIVKIKIPPLRERVEDIPILIRHFLNEMSFNKNPDGTPRVEGITKEAIDALMSYSWPGNIRELLNVIERATFLSTSGYIDVFDLPDYIAGKQNQGITYSHNRNTSEIIKRELSEQNFHKAKDEWIKLFERDYIKRILEKTGGNISRAAKQAGIDRKHLRNLIKKYDINVHELKKS